MLCYDNKTRLLISWVHSLFCHKDHGQGECRFYNSIELADCWENPSVVDWASVTALILQRLNCSEEELLESLREALETLGMVDRCGPRAKEIIKAVVTGGSLSSLLLGESSFSVDHFQRENSEWSHE